MVWCLSSGCYCTTPQLAFDPFRVARSIYGRSRQTPEEMPVPGGAMLGNAVMKLPDIAFKGSHPPGFWEPCKTLSPVFSTNVGGRPCCIPSIPCARGGLAFSPSRTYGVVSLPSLHFVLSYRPDLLASTLFSVRSVWQYVQYRYVPCLVLDIRHR